MSNDNGGALLPVGVLFILGVLLYFTAKPVDGELLKEGEDVTLKCVVDGIQTYHTIWQRNGEKLEGERYEISQQEKEQILTIKKASECKPTILFLLLMLFIRNSNMFFSRNEKCFRKMCTSKFP